MINYLLKDADGNTYDLNSDAITRNLKGSWTQGADTFDQDSEIIENSFLPGSQLIGTPRLASRTIELRVDATNPNDATFRAEMNELLEFLSRTRALVDVGNDMEISVVLRAGAIEYESGSLKKLSDNTFEFEALTPCWHRLTLDEVTGTVAGDTLTPVDVTNAGFLETPPIITLTAAGPVPSLQIFVSSTQEGIQLDDALFGTVGNETMVIDCEQGTVTIGDINRNASIGEGTGFFRLPVGVDTVQMLFADESVDYKIEFAKRYFV